MVYNKIMPQMSHKYACKLLPWSSWYLKFRDKVIAYHITQRHDYAFSFLNNKSFYTFSAYKIAMIRHCGDD